MAKVAKFSTRHILFHLFLEYILWQKADFFNFYAGFSHLLCLKEKIKPQNYRVGEKIIYPMLIH